MKKNKLFSIATICVAALFATSCNMSSKIGDNSRNALDWNGVYASVIPCADCEGIKTTIVLKRDNSYEITTQYLGKSTEKFAYSGKFEWNKAGNEITLSGIKKGEAPTKYLVGENKLVQLDVDGKRMAADVAKAYTLGKISDIVEKYWKLIELNESEVVVGENHAREPHMILRTEDSRVNGNGGCNSFFGTYAIQNPNGISFSKMGSTMMACPEMQTESQFLRTLETVESYAVNLDTLTLKNGEADVVARFVAVYLK